MRLTLEDNIKYLESIGFNLVHSKPILTVCCNYGHKFSRPFSEFKKGNIKCPECEIEEKVKFLDSIGYTYISGGFGLNLVVRCKNGHEVQKPFSSIIQYPKCPECEIEEKVKFLDSIGYTYISGGFGKGLVTECKTCKSTIYRAFDKYENYQKCPECEIEEKVKFLDSIGYTYISGGFGKGLITECKTCNIIYKRAFSDFVRGTHICSNCIKENKIQKLNTLGLTPVSKDLNHELLVKCINDHIFKRSYDNIINNEYVDCPECVVQNKILKLEGFGLTPISNNLSHNMKVSCLEGHIFQRGFNNLKRGSILCPTCYPNISSPELEIKTFLEELGVNFVHSDWNTISPKELDFYLPEHQLAIEYDGIYWHSELQGKNSKYHLEKTLMCKEKGINLLHIFENEWMNSTKREIWKSIIKGKLNLHSKIGARKCILKEVPKTEAKEFLNTNHLQGALGNSIALGLYYNDELINLMTFGKNRMGKEVEWELLRFASKLNKSVQGGASKLFKHFVKEYSENKGIVSYSDRRYSEGNMYNKLGFEFSHFSKPNYFYFKNTLTLESRQKYMKHKLKGVIETFDETLTEWENMKVNKFDRIWDCGNGVWVFKHLNI
jgi:very-short-patch-repair endonuclease